MVSRDSGFSSAESWSPQDPIEDLLSFILLPSFFFCWEEQAETTAVGGFVGRTETAEDEFVFGAEMTAVGGFAGRTEAAEDELVLETETTSVGGFSKGKVVSYGAGVDLAGQLYRTTLLCRVGQPLPRQPSFGLSQSSCFEVFSRPLCRNSFCLRQKREKQLFQPFSQFLCKQEKLCCSHRTQLLVRATEGHPGAWKAFRVFLLKICKISFFSFSEKSHIYNNNTTQARFQKLYLSSKTTERYGLSVLVCQ